MTGLLQDRVDELERDHLRQLSEMAWGEDTTGDRERTRVNGDGGLATQRDPLTRESMGKLIYQTPSS